MVCVFYCFGKRNLRKVSPMKKIAVVGAGIAGLSAARHLQEAGHQVVVWEKSRSLGGRCSSRLWEGSVVDHGAQYFTLRDPDFRSTVETLCPDCILPITAPILTETGSVLPLSSERFYHRSGNNRLGKALATGLDVRLDAPVESIAPDHGGWRIGDDTFDSVILTPPWPQASALLEIAGGKNSFLPCLTAIFAYQQPWEGLAREVYAWSSRQHNLAWTACENHKSGRIPCHLTVFIAQAGPAFSQNWLEAAPELWAAELRSSLEDRWQLSSQNLSAQWTHRWLYARIAAPVPLPDLPAGIYLTGDSYSESRVESAWLAGRNTASSLVNS